MTTNSPGQIADVDGGCLVRHRLEVGFGGVGRVLDPILKLYASDRFAAELDDHVHTEFPKLRDPLKSAPAA